MVEGDVAGIDFFWNLKDQFFPHFGPFLIEVVLHSLDGSFFFICCLFGFLVLLANFIVLGLPSVVLSRVIDILHWSWDLWIEIDVEVVPEGAAPLVALFIEFLHYLIPEVFG